VARSSAHSSSRRGVPAPDPWLDAGFVRHGGAVEYCDRGRTLPAIVGILGSLTRLLQVNIANLAAIPSVVYGLLGLGLFANLLGFGLGTAVTASLTLSLLILPITIISAQEAIRSVPDDLRRGSDAMGATRWQTTKNVVLPEAFPGILTGTILALGRAIGETAPLIMIGAATTVFSAPDSLFSRRGRRDHAADHPRWHERNGDTAAEPRGQETNMSNTEPSESLITTDVETGSNEQTATPDRTAVAARDLNVFYGDEQAIDDVSMEIPEKRVTALIGPSGCGKSTFLRCINRMNDMIEICRVEGRWSSAARTYTTPTWTPSPSAGRSGWCSRSRTRSRSRSATTSRTG